MKGNEEISKNKEKKIEKPKAMNWTWMATQMEVEAMRSLKAGLGLIRREHRAGESNQLA